MTNVTTTPDLSLCTPHELTQSSERWAQQAKASLRQAMTYERCANAIGALEVDADDAELEVLCEEAERLVQLGLELRRDSDWRRECGFWALGQGR